MFAETCPELVAAFVGHLSSGVIHVPINTRYKAEEARHILEDSGAVAVLTREGEECHAVLDEILREKKPPQLQHVLPLAAAFPSSPSKKSSLPLRLSEIDAQSHSAPPDDDVAMLIYTSGTTGKSKGVALSHRALEENTRAMMELWRFSPADRLVLALPLFHVHGLCLGVAGALLTGFTLLLEERFDAARVVEAFANEGATAFMGVPTMYVRLLEYLDAHPEGAEALRKARLFTAGSAPLPAADFAAFREKTGHAILERYGMSETLFTLSNPYEGERRPGTVGLPVPGCSVRLVDDEGRDAREGEPGEIHVKGNGLMSGYWGREADTAAAFRDGWFLTGDVARTGRRRVRDDPRPQVGRRDQERRLQDLGPRDRGRAPAASRGEGRGRRRPARPRLGPAHRGGRRARRARRRGCREERRARRSPPSRRRASRTSRSRATSAR